MELESKYFLYELRTTFHLTTENLIFVFENPNREILNVLDKNQENQVSENSSKLKPIVKTIISMVDR